MAVTQDGSTGVDRRGLLVSKTWLQAVALVVLLGFAVLGLLAYRTYTAEPPIPDRVVGADGRVLFTGKDVSRGQQVFLHSTCSMCHTIQGTTAGGRVGPDLTHVASRDTLAAGTLPNTVGHLAGWIVDPQKIKPGVRMPQNSLSPDDLRGLLEYLESLK